MKYFLLIFSLFLFSCTSEKEKKLNADNAYSKVQKIPASQPCENYEGYKKLRKVETSQGTAHYKEITDSKIEEYFNKCEDLKISLEKERLRKEELKKMGLWEYSFYVDEFGDYTNKGFVSLTTLGTFSNTATKNSPLKVEMYLNDGSTENPWFRLYEYAGNNPITGIYSDSSLNRLNCKAKDISGYNYNFSLNQGKGSNGFFLSRYKDSRSIKQILSKSIFDESEIRFYCQVQERSSTSYSFKFDLKYFSNAYREFQEFKIDKN
tara:strand:- start:163 stop:954 length:792 start_codon:yes stop_codon:yes gene_type:complete